MRKSILFAVLLVCGFVTLPAARATITEQEKKALWSLTKGAGRITFQRPELFRTNSVVANNVANRLSAIFRSPGVSWELKSEYLRLMFTYKSSWRAPVLLEVVDELIVHPDVLVREAGMHLASAYIRDGGNRTPKTVGLIVGVFNDDSQFMRTRQAALDALLLPFTVPHAERASIYTADEVAAIQRGLMQHSAWKAGDLLLWFVAEAGLNGSAEVAAASVLKTFIYGDSNVRNFQVNERIKEIVSNDVDRMELLELFSDAVFQRGSGLFEDNEWYFNERAFEWVHGWLAQRLGKLVFAVPGLLPHPMFCKSMLEINR